MTTTASVGFDGQTIQPILNVPVSINKLKGKKGRVRVSTPNGVKAKNTTPAKAKRQARLLNAVDHGWKPTGKPAKESLSTMKTNSSKNRVDKIVDDLLENDSDKIQESIPKLIVARLSDFIGTVSDELTNALKADGLMVDYLFSVNNLSTFPEIAQLADQAEALSDRLRSLGFTHIFTGGLGD